MANTLNKFYIDDTTWESKLAVWSSMATDLGAYYGYYSYFREEDSKPTEYLKVAKPLSSLDTWRVPVDTGYFYNGNEIVGIAAGYFPTLNHWVEQIISPGDYALCRYNDKLEVGSSQFIASTFKEGVVPYCLGVLVHGAGGGGGGTDGTNDGTGGGAGGCIAGVLVLRENATIHVGAGGAGGYKKEVNSSVGGGGGIGGVSYIYLGGYAFQADGGGPGRSSTKSQAYAGGTGGTCKSTGPFQFCASSKQGGNGGKVYSLQNATGMAAQTVKFTALTTVISGATHTTVPATSGGAQGDNKAPGGGGGGREYNGPAGAAAISDGKAGIKGCGGSGARFTLAVYKRGGKGGDGYVTLFY